MVAGKKATLNPDFDLRGVLPTQLSLRGVAIEWRGWQVTAARKTLSGPSARHALAALRIRPSLRSRELEVATAKSLW